MKNILTKKLFYFLALFMVSLTTVAQDGEGSEEIAPEVVIDMDFNKSIYPENEGNAYFSNEPKAALIGMIVPKKYSELIAEMKKDPSEGIKNLKTGEFDNAGKKVFFYSGNITVENDKEIFMEVLVKHSDENKCIVVTSMYEPSVKEKFGKEAKRAIISAKVNE
ncbi:hypothetical protein G6N05_00190 [Flavobacterium sp. F372]|jgi:hypothetical protein|uniref:DUF1795 domain-containing protein n=1 Tax=Flavobacterium bernardetii TaxID=2813823 RepID=A0ABR7IU47_9FLAO|nr:hypothetical protein [Flavobacterium bernardetii]MBC5833290.1 hypothetical protein [Flavobacterium bernardetii]NHF68522.1 hypothetical protein [Flavobacterium bernardetii]